MKESVNGSKITMVLNIVVIIFTLLVIIMGLSCLAEAERARAELSDVRQALEELRSSTPLDQFWTQKALQKVRTGASPGEDVKTVFLTCKREGDSGGSDPRAVRPRGQSARHSAGVERRAESSNTVRAASGGPGRPPRPGSRRWSEKSP